MPDQHLQHVTADGDRWDLLAYRYYGDAFAYQRIVDANPGVPLVPVLRAGYVLRIPLVERAQAGAPRSLPPWKR